MFLPFNVSNKLNKMILLLRYGRKRLFLIAVVVEIIIIIIMYHHHNNQGRAREDERRHWAHGFVFFKIICIYIYITN